MKNPERFDQRRLQLDSLIRRFFASNAVVAMVVLALITLFLVREGAGFFGQNLHGLRVYRLAGLEVVDWMRAPVEGHTALNRTLQDLRLKQVEVLLASGVELEAANARLAPYDLYVEKFDAAVEDLREVTSDLVEVVSAIKERVKMREDAVEGQQFLLNAGKTDEANAVSQEALAPIDFAKEIAPVKASYPEFFRVNKEFQERLKALLREKPPEIVAPELQPRFQQFEKGVGVYLQAFPEVEQRVRGWDQFAPVPWSNSVTSFLFGTQWITNSFWQDCYGVLPLVTGSLMVSGIAMMIAIPCGVAAAVYLSEVATAREQQWVKPIIEFISAIPSVVLGFFGIAVLGETLRAVTQWEALSWISFFPIAERLNAFTAGTLLAFMAIPTIFTLAEDALTSVPRAFKEASYALGANRYQTIFRVILPAAISGIVSAVLLGFGRVIGETMVVLLCAGNRIAIPDFSGGAGTIFQPVHTMTGIIAQEMGEVVRGSVQYRALFMVGLLLFLLSLLINGTAQALVRRYKISVQ